MKIGKWFRAFEWVHVVFGSGYLDRFVVIEIKYLFSIYYNVWNTIEHDRFHQHAFSAISFMLKGSYYEEELHKGVRLVKAPLVRFISRSNNHRMLKSEPNSISISIAGPWDRLWTETLLNGQKRILTWERKEEIGWTND